MKIKKIKNDDFWINQLVRDDNLFKIDFYDHNKIDDKILLFLIIK